MGGTSTDVTAIVDEPAAVTDVAVADLRLRTPALDIHTIAAGGGSIARWDGLALTVGPDSAGARPGPICASASPRPPSPTAAAPRPRLRIR